MYKKAFFILVISIISLLSFRATAKLPITPHIEIPKITLADSATFIFSDSIVHPNYMFIPIIFVNQQIVDPQIPKALSENKTKLKLDVDDQWLNDIMKKTTFETYHINEIIYRNPSLVKYNVTMLPEPPKQYIITVDPSKATLTLEEFKIEVPKDMPSAPDIKPKNWIHGFNSSLQFSQAYLSDNWYQGGNSNLNLLGNILFNIKLNQIAHPKLLFETSIQYKISLNSAPQDSLRTYSISEDLFQLNSKFGIKAAKNWFYTTSIQFKSQFFQNFAANTYDLKASFLTPGEFNAGIGMTYNKTNKSKSVSFDASISPLSYNMKICLANDKVDPVSLGMEAGKKILNQIGSSVEGKLVWKLHTNITFRSRLFVFTNYDYIQGDLENTFNFSINKYLSTQFYVHLRYDTSSEIVNQSWKHWQLKEILSFGFNYRI